MEIRKLDLADLPQAHDLSSEAFGPPPAGSPQPVPPPEPPPGRHSWGAFDGGRLVAKAVALEFTSWFGGAEVPTCGIAGVAVAAEHRGGGLLRQLFTPLLEESVARGEVISTLYPTANGIYRGLGYELISSYDQVEIPTADLARVRPPLTVRTRRATAADVPAMQEVYAAWAAAQNGPLTRTGPRYGRPAEQELADHTGVTLAVDTVDGVEQVVGWGSWVRSDGYGPQGVVEVWTLVGLSADAYRAIWLTMATFASVAGTVRLRTSGADPARLVLPTAAWGHVARHAHPYSLRVSDVAGALTARAVHVPGLAAEVPFAVAGDVFGASDGHYLLTLGDARGLCGRVSEPSGGAAVPTFTPQGIALAFAGAQSCANLRLLDHLTGPDTHDLVLDAALGGRPLHIHDYF
ncbi:MAG: GNAT family N-acetyltransferase [Rhodoferax sp.]|nr:GNAT family N-acetyltransferase [Actinomycetota bacterium]